jgi:hypothetical protein
MDIDNYYGMLGVSLHIMKTGNISACHISPFKKQRYKLISGSELMHGQLLKTTRNGKELHNNTENDKIKQ